MNLKDEIFRLWAACQNEHERGEVLGQIEGARHEIRVEYLWAQPELRHAVAALEGDLTAVMRGSYRVAPVQSVHVQGDATGGAGQREALLVGRAGYVAMLLAMQAEFRVRQHAELQGRGYHACRIRDAMEIRHCHARPVDGMTGYVYPVDPETVPCSICEAEKGRGCVMVAGASPQSPVTDLKIGE